MVSACLSHAEAGKAIMQVPTNNVKVASHMTTHLCPVEELMRCDQQMQELGRCLTACMSPLLPPRPLQDRLHPR